MSTPEPVPGAQARQASSPVRPLRQRRLAVRIYAVTLGAFVVLMLIITLIGRFLQQARREPVALRARYLLSKVLERPTTAERATELERIHNEMQLDLSLFGPDGRLIASTLTPPASPLTPHQLQLMGQEGSLLLDQEARGWTAAVPVDPGAPARGYAVLRQIPLPRGTLSLPWAMLLVMLVLAPASLYLAGALARPLERLAEVARRFGSGQLTARTGMQRKDELGEVARAFDEMADRVTALLRAQTELLANVSHEFRTPLSRIRIALDLADEGEAGQTRESLAEIATDLAELEQLVSDVLTAARLDLKEGRTGLQLPVHAEPTTPDALLTESAQRFRRTHGQRALELQLAPGLPELYADRALLHRVVGNLLDNAQKYSDREQPITLRASAEKEGVAIEVEDRGIGIDAQDLDQVFQPFFRSERSRARTTGGVGLGLTLARRIVEAHGGRISLTSQVGQGTRVRVWLPGGPSSSASGAAVTGAGRASAW